MSSSKIRQSNIELMRIISMLFIIIWHILVHGRVFYNLNNPTLEVILRLVDFLVVVHVNSFVLATGYFQIKSNFKQSKVWALLNASLFYRIVIMMIFMYFGISTFTKVDVMKNFFIFDTVEYWFLKCYLVLYFISPFLNSYVKHANKKEHGKLLAVLFIFLALVPYLTNGQTFYNSGYSLYSFVFLYLVGAYLRKYPLRESYIFKNLSLPLFRTILIGIFLGCAFSNYLLYFFSGHMVLLNSIFKEIFSAFRSNALVYSNPFVVIQSVAYFLIFDTLKLQSKFINKIAGTVIGVYLIHDNSLVRKTLYKFLRIDNGPITSYTFLIHILLVALLILVVCVIIETLRKTIFKFIYNWKISRCIRERYYKFCDEFFKSRKVFDV